MRRFSLVLGAALLVAACASAKREPLPGRHRLDGSLAVAATSRAPGEALIWQRGAVSRGDTQIPFTVDGLEVAVGGFSGLVVVGEVYNLHRPEDLAGTYERALADLDPGDEPGSVILGNEHGVLLVLRVLGNDAPIGPARSGMVMQLAE